MIDRPLGVPRVPRNDAELEQLLQRSINLLEARNAQHNLECGARGFFEFFQRADIQAARRDHS